MQNHLEDDGTLYIMATDSSAAQKAKELIEAIIAEVEGARPTWEQMKHIMDFGALWRSFPESWAIRRRPGAYLAVG